MTFANHVAIISGASSGIGWALAKRLAAEGAKLGLVARRQDKLQALAQEIGQAGGTAAFAAADVGHRALQRLHLRTIGHDKRVIIKSNLSQSDVAEDGCHTLAHGVAAAWHTSASCCW